MVQRQASAADATYESNLEALQFGYSLSDALVPRLGQTRPISTFGRLIGGKLIQFGANFLQCESDTLRKHDERHTPCYHAWVATMTRLGALSLNEPTLLVEPQRRRRDASAYRKLADREEPNDRATIVGSTGALHGQQKLRVEHPNFKCA